MFLIYSPELFQPSEKAMVRDWSKALTGSWFWLIEGRDIIIIDSIDVDWKNALWDSLEVNSIGILKQDYERELNLLVGSCNKFSSHKPRDI